MSDRVRATCNMPAAGSRTHQSPGVARLAGPVQQGTGAAANVEHGPGRHHQRQVEAKVGTLLPSAERIVERRETRLGELAVDHRTSLSAKTQSRIPAILLLSMR